MAYVVKRTAAAGGAEAKATGASDLYAVLEAAMTAAGWTVSPGGFFSSTGENGREAIFLRWALDGIYLHLYQWQYDDGSAGYNQIYNATYKKWTIAAGSYDYVVIADKDSVAWYLGPSGTYGQYGFAGNLRRDIDVNPINIRTTVPILPGRNVNVALAEDPTAFGYDIGDPVMIAAQETPAAGSTIPIFSAIAVDVGSDYVVLDRVPEAVAAGALFGQDPCPYAGSISANRYPFGAHFISVGNSPRRECDNIWTARAQADYGYVTHGVAPIHEGVGDPNKRTGRAVIERIYLETANQDSVVYSTVRGFLDKIWQIKGNGWAIWDIARTPKTNPVREYVIISCNSERCVIGPV